MFLELYGIQVKDCYAETLNNKRLKILSNGCSTERIVISDLQYMDNCQKAFSDSLGFKFAEEKDIWLFCDVKLCIQRQAHLRINSKEAERDLCPLETKVIIYNL